MALFVRTPFGVLRSDDGGDWVPVKLTQTLPDIDLTLPHDPTAPVYGREISKAFQTNRYEQEQAMNNSRFQSSSFTGRSSRTMQSAFGPYTDSRIEEPKERFISHRSDRIVMASSILAGIFLGVYFLWK